MNKYIKGFLPIIYYFVFIIESFTFYSFAKYLGVDEESPGFLFVYFLIMSPTIIAFFWSIGSLLKRKSESLCRLFRIIPIIACGIGIIILFINLIHPLF